MISLLMNKEVDAEDLLQTGDETKRNEADLEV